MTQGIDILALIEMWLGTDSNPSVISESVPAGNGFLQISHKEGKRGGGVAIIYRSGFNVTMNKTEGA